MTSRPAPDPGSLNPGNFVDHLRSLAQDRPDDIWLTVVGESSGQAVEKTITYAAFEQRVRALAASLQQRLVKGDRALVMLDNDDHYAVSMLACFYAGVVAVPVFPPESMRPQHLARLAGIAEDSQAACILTTSALGAAMAAAAGQLGSATAIAVDQVAPALAGEWLPFAPAGHDLAFLQYTSGSTSAPKGVMVTHGNLMANERAIRSGMGIGPGDKFVSWAPLYHDMGLIGGLMQPLYSAIPLVLTSPRYFLERPVRWLELISRHRATLSGGPDFAYRLCLDRIKDSRLDGLDLSTWRVAYTGAEPVRADTGAEFIQKFSGVGFNPKAVYACYGLAEATLFVTGGERGGGMLAGSFSAESLARGEGAQAGEGEEAATLVGCGAAAPDHVVRITSPESLSEVQAGQVGEIWTAGPSICSGYWGKERESQETFVAHEGRRWLRTGDLGFQRNGQLYVTGRIKDLIIIRGHNIYPQDIERTIEAEVDAVRKGRVAAFVVPGPEGEGIGVAVEVSRSMQKLVAPHALVDALGAAVSEVFGEPLSAVVLLNPGALPKTSSGKLQRQACRKGLADRSLDAYAIHEHGAFVMGGGVEAPGEAEGAPDELAQDIAGIWKEVLKWPAGRVLAQDAHFFSSGGNSLASVQAAARIAKRWNIAFSLRDLFEHPRLQACAALVRSRIDHPDSRNLVDVPIVPLSAERRLQPAPLSHAQERQWFLWKLAPESTAYHVSGALRLSGALDVAAMRASFDGLAARHESLRTVFLAGPDGTAQQWIQPSSEPLLNLADLRQLPPGEREALAAEQALRLHATPFDLAQGPPVRVELIRLAEESHVLVVVMHHIISDGASMQILLDEVAADYAALSMGAGGRPGAARIQYVDHAAWEREWLAAGVAARQLAWWREQLGHEHPVLALPTDRPRQAHGGYHAARHAFEVPGALLARLRAAAQEAGGSTLFMILLAAFQALLHRYSSQEDIRVGVPVANRNRVETEGLIGFFVNTLVLRNAVHSGMPLSQVLRQAREAVLGAQTHQDLPFEQLVEALHPQRSLGQSPLFQVMFNHLAEDYRTLEAMSGLEAAHYPLPDLAAQFELVLEARESPDGRLTMALVYAAELFDAQTVERMAGHYLAVLESMAGRPQQAVGEVALLGEAERAQLAAWGENTRRHEGAQPVHRQFERHARLTPLAPALVFADEALSYGELNARANRLAHRLIALGVGPDVLAGIAAERSIDMMVGILAILKAGGAYVPLDPDYPADRLAYMAADSGISLLLTQSRLRTLIPAIGALRVLELDTLDLGGEPEDDPHVDLHGEHLAYVIYTSGSTGKPKGAAVRHQALHSCMAWMQETYRLAGTDTVLHKAPFGFDVSAWEMFWPLTSGVRLVIANPGDHRDPVRLVELIRRHQVTTLNFVPSMLQAFLAYDGIEATTRLKHIICGGEAMPAATQKEALQRLSGATLQNLYGPTETTIHVTQWTCRDDGRSQVPIGRPISDTQAYVLDARLNQVPAGVAGELYVGGVNLARGYLKRAGLTAERFVAGEGGGRLYRTGDLVRWNNEGQLEYLGRIDQQVKVRGFRIELGEIEAQLLAQPEVREAVVVANDDSAGTRLVGYVSAHAGQAVDVAVLRERLAQALPDYMVPRVIVVLESLPLNANGKVDRKALPHAEAASDQVYEAPQGETAQAVAAIWSDVLQVGKVGIHDNFFDLGGHSLLLVRVHRLLEERLSLSLALVNLFKYPTVGSLAQWIERGAAKAAPATDGDDRALRQRAAMLQRRKPAERVN